MGNSESDSLALARLGLGYDEGAGPGGGGRDEHGWLARAARTSGLGKGEERRLGREVSQSRSLEQARPSFSPVGGRAMQRKLCWSRQQHGGGRPCRRVGEARRDETRRDAAAPGSDGHGYGRWYTTMYTDIAARPCSRRPPGQGRRKAWKRWEWGGRVTPLPVHTQ